MKEKRPRTSNKIQKSQISLYKNSNNNNQIIRRLIPDIIDNNYNSYYKLESYFDKKNNIIYNYFKSHHKYNKQNDFENKDAGVKFIHPNNTRNKYLAKIKYNTPQKDYERQNNILNEKNMNRCLSSKIKLYNDRNKDINNGINNNINNNISGSNFDSFLYENYEKYEKQVKEFNEIMGRGGYSLIKKSKYNELMNKRTIQSSYIPNKNFLKPIPDHIFTPLTAFKSFDITNGGHGIIYTKSFYRGLSMNDLITNYTSSNLLWKIKKYDLRRKKLLNNNNKIDINIYNQNINKIRYNRNYSEFFISALNYK